MTSQRIKVMYPADRLGDRQLVLRTSLDDWSDDHRPLCEGDSWTFEVPTNEPYFHFKPCLKGETDFHWSVGSNYVAPFPTERVLYPVFHSPEHGTVSDVQTIQSPQGPYRYRVYLPAGYEENTLRRYPVCYMHDGHNLFFPDEAFGGRPWQVNRTLELLDRMNSIESCIVVAVYPRERFDDYTEPGAHQYAKFMGEQLLPTIEKNYRTLHGPEHRVVMGSSLGGLVSFYLVWHHNDLFGRAACLSSTFGYDNKLFQAVKRSRKKRAFKVYLDSGWPGDNFAVTQAMAHLLVGRGYTLGVDVQYVAVPEATHDEFAWGSRLHLPFQFLLGLSYGQDRVIDLPSAA